jgi:selenophosphate synthetase-related protein
MVVVSIGEKDLMEFERICMAIGVPSTTIGRVTNDNQFKFNDVVKINRKKF